MPNVSGFVQSKEAGERVVALFNGRARLDYRTYEPNWIQVKVGCIPEHEAVLHRLCHASWGCSGMLSEDIIKWALDPEGCPGLEPKGLRWARELKAKLASYEDAPGVDSAARRLAKWFGYSFDGIREGRLTEWSEGRFTEQWCYNGIGRKEFQGGKQDLRDLVKDLMRLAKEKPPSEG